MPCFLRGHCFTVILTTTLNWRRLCCCSKNRLKRIKILAEIGLTWDRTKNQSSSNCSERILTFATTNWQLVLESAAVFFFCIGLYPSSSSLPGKNNVDFLFFFFVGRLPWLLGCRGYVRFRMYRSRDAAHKHKSAPAHTHTHTCTRTTGSRPT